MKFLIFILCLSSAFADEFENEARILAKDLKSSLMKNLSEKISKDGVLKAIPFCHSNVRPIAKAAAKGRESKYEFGRTSHRVRSASNRPTDWMEKYLVDFQGSFKKDNKPDHIIHNFKNSKKAYLEPLYVEAKCLLCHGENVSQEVNNEIQRLYPGDKATGFKLGEFRGFIWIKEK